MINYALILGIFYENAEYVLNGDEYSDLVWLDSSVKPTQEELDSLWEQAKKQNDFVSNRKKAYPSFAEQFDILYHGGFDAWKETIDAVKNQYPKP